MMKNMLILPMLVIFAFFVKPIMAQDNEEPIPIEYGDVDVADFTIPYGTDFAKYQIYIFYGEAGDVIDIAFEFVEVEGISGLLSLTDVTTGKSYEGIQPLMNILIPSYPRFALEDFRLPSTGNYIIEVEIHGYDGGLIPSYSTDYSLTLDGKRIKDRQLFQALSVYTVAYSRAGVELGTVEYDEWSRIALLQVGKEPADRSSGVHFGELCPSFSPDGKTMIYAGYEAIPPIGIEGVIKFEPAVAIFSRPVNGGSRTMILEDLTGDIGLPRYSPDGTQITFHQQTAKDIFEVFIFDTRTRITTQVTDLGAQSRYPSWSPDGKKLLFHSDTQGHYDIYTISLDGTDLRRLTNSSNDEYRAIYSPDGKQIVYTVETKDNFGLFLMDSTGANQRPLTSRPYSTSQAWTPDGKWILFQSYAGDNSNVQNLYFIHSTGGAPVRITDPMHSNECGTVSPIVIGQSTPTPVPTSTIIPSQATPTPTTAPPTVTPTITSLPTKVIEEGVVLAWGLNDHNQINVPPDLHDVKEVAAGMWHSVALKKDGTVVIWGDGVKDIPEGLQKVKTIAANASYVLALQEDGRVAAWGWDGWYDGNGVLNVPKNLKDVKAIDVGATYALALKNDGTVVAWGRDGNGTDIPDGLKDVKAIAAGFSHAVALKSDGTLVAWGRNDFGQATIPGGLKKVIAIDAGYLHTLALQEDGTVVAWGLSDDGQLDIPEGLDNVVAIAAGAYHNLALKKDGTVVAWGREADGRTNIPSTLTNVKAIAAGESHSLIIK
jgi:hypothetical protein